MSEKILQLKHVLLSQVLVRRITWKKPWSFCHDRIQLNVLRQTATSRLEGSLTFQGLTASPSLGCYRWLGKTKTDNQVPYPVLCISPLGLGAVWNETPLVSGSSQEVIAHGLGCLLLLV